MAQTATASRPQLVGPRKAQTLEAVRNVTGNGSFDPDIWHVMDERDNALIEQEILHGSGSSKFVYSFPIAGQREPVAGISVIGARHLATHYGGLKHRLVAAMQKTLDLFTFTSYPADGVPMQVQCSVIPELEGEADFYTAVCEITDIKTGNTIQMERREHRYEKRSEEKGGGEYERPHYATIAQSKAYRNAVLALIPQDVQIRWKLEMLKLKKEDVITESVLDQKRANVLQFAARRAIQLDRRALEELTVEQIAGLGDAARDGSVPAFVAAARAMGLEIGGEESVGATTQQPGTPPKQQETTSGRPPAATEKPPQQQQQETPATSEPGPARRVNFEV
jgi:hypothetical protein